MANSPINPIYMSHLTKEEWADHSRRLPETLPETVSYVSITPERLAELEAIEATFNAIDGDKYKQAYMDGKPRVGFVQVHIGYIVELNEKAAKWDKWAEFMAKLSNEKQKEA